MMRFSQQDITHGQVAAVIYVVLVIVTVAAVKYAVIMSVPKSLAAVVRCISIRMNDCSKPSPL